MRQVRREDLQSLERLLRLEVLGNVIAQLVPQSYAVDNNDQYPIQTVVTQPNMRTYVDNWPKNPWSASGAYMGQGGATWSAADMGNYYYNTTSTGFVLTGYGKSKAVITVP